MLGGRGIRSADREQMSDKTRMPQRYSVDYCSSPSLISSDDQSVLILDLPVMPAQDNLTSSQLSGQLFDVVRGSFLAIKGEGFRGNCRCILVSLNIILPPCFLKVGTYSSTKPHDIWTDDSKAHLQQERNLISPTD